MIDRSVLVRCTTLTKLRDAGDFISSILNWVCPECGGRMGGPGREFKCQGRCHTDWRLVWENVFSSGVRQAPGRASRPS